MVKIISICIVLAVIATGVGFWFVPRVAAPDISLPPIEEGVMCTMDALQCPDGSYVGRTGSSCEFVCPALPAVPAAAQSALDAHADILTLATPVPLGLIENGVTVSGQARGSWYFEGSFPIELISSTGTVIARAVAAAQSDWMTTEFVPFTAVLQFVNPYNVGADESQKTGALILRKDNPSGEPERDDALEIPVRFAP